MHVRDAVLDADRDRSKLGDVDIPRRGCGLCRPGTDETAVCLVGGSSDQNGAQAEDTGLCQSFDDPAHYDRRSWHACSNESVDQMRPLVACRLDFAETGDTFGDGRIVGRTNVATVPFGFAVCLFAWPVTLVVPVAPRFSFSGEGCALDERAVLCELLVEHGVHAALEQLREQRVFRQSEKTCHGPISSSQA